MEGVAKLEPGEEGSVWTTITLAPRVPGGHGHAVPVASERLDSTSCNCPDFPVTANTCV